MTKTLAALALAALVLSGCSSPDAPATAAQASAAAGSAASRAASAAPAASAEVLASLGLAGLDGRQIVEKLDQSPVGRPLPMKASVRPDQVIVGNGQAETSVPLTGPDSFYVSIAPYTTRTHDCFFHSLATCQGEMVGKPVHVTIADSAGTVLVDQDATTYANGFVGFWLPRNITGTVTVTTDGKKGTVPFATGPQDATCLTTLKVG